MNAATFPGPNFLILLIYLYIGGHLCWIRRACNGLASYAFTAFVVSGLSSQLARQCQDSSARFLSLEDFGRSEATATGCPKPSAVWTACQTQWLLFLGRLSETSQLKSSRPNHRSILNQRFQPQLFLPLRTPSSRSPPFNHPNNPLSAISPANQSTSIHRIGRKSKTQAITKLLEPLS